MAIEEKIVSFEKLSRYDQQIKAYIDHELSQIETGTDTNDATATADKVFLDETFYAGGQKRTGTFTIQSELDSQDELIASIKTALEGKTAGSGGDTLKTLLDATKRTTYLFYHYAGTSVEGLIPYNATENVTNMGNTFYNCNNLISVPLFNTSKATIMSQMFSDCASLASVPLFDTSNVTDMSNMVYGCSSLTEVPFFDTSNVTTMHMMFYNCSKLTKAPLFNTSKVTTMQNMFYGCASLIEAPTFNVPVLINVRSMFEGCTNLKRAGFANLAKRISNSRYWFYNCTSLEVIDFRGTKIMPALENTNAFTGVPSTCKVVIPDALYDTWTKETNWSAINVTWVKESEYTEE